MIDSQHLASVRAADPSLISDCMLRLGLAGWMDGVRPVKPGRVRAAGRARTILFGPKRGEGAWPHSMYSVIASLSADDVLVFAAGGTSENLMGDNMALMAQIKGLAALVTDSPVRDGAAIAALDLPVFSRGTTMRLPIGIEPVALDVPVVCGGAQVRPGDLFLGCEDGGLVVPESRVPDVVDQLDSAADIERELTDAITSRASLETIEAIMKRRKLIGSRK